MSGGSINPIGILGALGGAAASGDSKVTASSDPWSPAQPFIQSNIDSASRLQKYYQDNPLSDLQRRAYTNSFNGTDNFRQGIASLSSQLGNNQGWSRNSGSRLPQGYNFMPLGGQSSGGGGGGGGGLLTGGLPTNPFSGGSVIPASGGSAGGSSGGSASGGGGGRNSGGQAWDGGEGRTGYQGNLTDKDWADIKQMRDLGIDTGDGAGLLGLALAAAAGGPLPLIAAGLYGSNNSSGIRSAFQDAKSANGGGTSSTVTPAGVVPSNPMGVDPAQAAVAKLNGVPAAPAPAPAPVNPFAGMFYDREYGGYVDSLGNFFPAQAPDTTASTGGGGSGGGAWTGGGGYSVGTGGYGKPGEAGGGFATGGGWGV